MLSQCPNELFFPKKNFTCCRISRNCLILFVGISRADIFSAGELSAFDVEFELFDASFVIEGIDVFDIPAFRSRNRRLLGGNVSISEVIFDGLLLVIELLVLLASPAPVLEHELASSF